MQISPAYKADPLLKFQKFYAFVGIVSAVAVAAIVALGFLGRPYPYMQVPYTATWAARLYPEQLLADNMPWLASMPALSQKASAWQAARLLLGLGPQLAAPWYAFGLQAAPGVIYLMSVSPEQPIAAEQLEAIKAALSAHGLVLSKINNYYLVSDQKDIHEGKNALNDAEKVHHLPTSKTNWTAALAGPGHLVVALPDAAFLSNTKVGTDSTLLHGRLIVRAWSQSGLLHVKAAYSPLAGNPLQGYPILAGQGLALPSMAMGQDMPGRCSGAVSWRLRKKAAWELAYKQRRWSVIRIFADLFKLPLEDIITAAGPDGLLALATPTGPDNKLAAAYTTTIQRKALLQDILSQMKNQGTITGRGPMYSLLGQRQLILGTSDTHLRFQFGRYFALPQAKPLPGVSAALRLDSGGLATIGSFPFSWAAKGKRFLAPVASGIAGRVLNLEDGSFLISAEVQLLPPARLLSLADVSLRRNLCQTASPNTAAGAKD